MLQIDDLDVWLGQRATDHAFHTRVLLVGDVLVFIDGVPVA